MIIACWSPVHRQPGTTINTALIGSHCALKSNKKVLLIDSQFNFGNLQEIIKPYADDGMSAIFTYAKTENLTDEHLEIYCSPVIQNKLYIIGATRQKMVELEIDKCFGTILKCASQKYSYVFVDTNAGIFNKNTNVVLENSDKIIVFLPQDSHILNHYFEKSPDYWTPILEQKEIIYVIGNYFLDYDHFTLRKIKRDYNIKELYGIPNNKYLHKAFCEERFLRWVLSNSDKPTKGYNKELSEGINSIVDKILGAPERVTLFSKMVQKVN